MTSYNYSSVNLYTHTCYNHFKHSEIRLYGVNKKKQNVCLRVQNFKPYIYIEPTEIPSQTLSEILKSNHYKKLVIKKHLIPTYSHFKIVRNEAITEYKPFPKETPEILDKKALIEYVNKYRDHLPSFINKYFYTFPLIHYIQDCGRKEKLYYANGTHTSSSFTYNMYPMTKLIFKNVNAIYSFMNIIKEDEHELIYVFENIKRTLPIKIHEHIRNIYLQFLSNYNIPSTGWINYKYLDEDIVAEGDKVTYCDIEVIVKCQNISENKTLQETISPCIVSFDIEAYSKNKKSFPNPENNDDCIFQISAVIQNVDKSIEKYLFSLKPNIPDYRLNFELPEDKKIIQRLYVSESELILGFRNLLLEKKPHVVIGYNIMGFDLEYIIKRDINFNGEMATNNRKFQQHGFYKYDSQNQYYKQARVKNTTWSSSAYKNQTFTWVDAEGMIYIDLYPLIKRDYRLRNYKLKTAALEFLTNVEKDPLTVKDIFDGYQFGVLMEGKMSRAERNKKLSDVGKYCVQDSYVVLKLFKKLEMWIGLNEMAKVCNVPIYYLYTKGQQIKIFSQVYKYCTNNKIVIDMDGYIKDEDYPFEGAYVVTPVPGVYDRVIPFDFSSLYPTTIIAYNIDYRTLVKDPTVPDEMCHIIEWTDEENKTHSFRFLKQQYKKGVIPTLLQNLLGARSNTKKNMKYLKSIVNTLSEEKKADTELQIKVLNKRQLAFKVSANSMYGAMGVKAGYLPFMEGAICTTAKGREHIREAQRILLQDFKGELVYGDTDSCYIRFPEFDTKTLTELWDHAVDIERQLTLPKYKKAIPDPMKLEFEEAIYNRFLILTKKRYMATKCKRNGIILKKLETKGVLLARRDNSGFIRSLYEQVVRAILDSKDFGHVRDNIIDPFIRKITEYKFITKKDFEPFIKSSSIGDWVGENDQKDGLHIGDYKYKPLPKEFKKRRKRLQSLRIHDRHNGFKCNRDPVNCDYCRLEEEEYKVKFLPAVVQLAIRLRKRGLLVAPGERLNYVVIENGMKNQQLCFKIEDPLYIQKNSKYINIDKLYYLDNCVKPVDQLLDVGYKQKDILKTIVKVKKKAAKNSVNHLKLKIKFEEYGKTNMPNIPDDKKHVITRQIKSYKIPDLQELCKKLNIEYKKEGKRRKKQFYIDLLQPYIIHKSKIKKENRTKTRI